MQGDLEQRTSRCGIAIAKRPARGCVALIDVTEGDARPREDLPDRSNESHLCSLLAGGQERETDDHAIDPTLCNERTYALTEHLGRVVRDRRERKRNTGRIVQESDARMPAADVESEAFHFAAASLAILDFLCAAFFGWMMCFFAAVSIAL